MNTNLQPIGSLATGQTTQPKHTDGKESPQPIDPHAVKLKDGLSDGTEAGLDFMTNRLLDPDSFGDTGTTGSTSSSMSDSLLTGYLTAQGEVRSTPTKPTLTHTQALEQATPPKSPPIGAPRGRLYSPPTGHPTKDDKSDSTHVQLPRGARPRQAPVFVKMPATPGSPGRIDPALIEATERSPGMLKFDDKSGAKPIDKLTARYCMHQPELRDKLLEHCKKWLSDENSGFIFDLMKFHLDPKPDSASAIMKTYVITGSPSMINLPDSIRTSVVDGFARIQLNLRSDPDAAQAALKSLFQDAEDEIHKLVDSDVIPRFRTALAAEKTGSPDSQG